MPSESQRWDPATFGFVTTVLRVMLGMGVLVVAGGLFGYRVGVVGIVTGAVLAILLYLVAMRAGMVFSRTKNYSQTMLWLLLSQFILWVGMALSLAVAKVNPVGFLVGVSILPVAILVTLAWYALRKRWMPS